MVDEVLSEEKNSGQVEVYVDDILVHTKDLAENRYWTGRVLSKLEEYHLFCQKEKCSFKVKQVEFLGVMLSEGSISVSPGKVKAIMEEKAPGNRKGVWQFLGITNYYWKFIRDYSMIM
jgi:hypothetical protein